MKFNELTSILNDYLKINKSKIYCFAEMIISLLKVKTVNLVELSCGMEGEAKQESKYKRLKRFFCNAKINQLDVAKMVMEIFIPKGKVYLSMDRTNWCIGKTSINILMLSVVYKGTAFPIMWTMLSKKGNSKTQERIELITRFIEQFGKEKISGILADREFIGDDWFAWLKREDIPFCIRIKSNMISTNEKGLEVDVNGLFYNLKKDEKLVLKKPRVLGSQEVYLSGLKLSTGELLIQQF